MAVKSYLDKNGLKIFHDALVSKYIEPIKNDMVTENDIDTNISSISDTDINSLFTELNS